MSKYQSILQHNITNDIILSSSDLDRGGGCNMQVYRVEDTLAKWGLDESLEPFDWLSGKGSRIHST